MMHSPIRTKSCIILSLSASLASRSRCNRRHRAPHMNIFSPRRVGRISESTTYCNFKISSAAVVLFVLVICYIATQTVLGKTSHSSSIPSVVKGSTAMMSSTGSSGSSSNNLRFRTAPVPSFLYGTAWKKERTQALVEQAIRSGFRGIDTACQPKHYYEAGVGAALDTIFADGKISRQDLFLQTKFTSLHGQDPKNLPYDKDSPLEVQVFQSFQRSCENLHTEYLDSWVLHSPLSTFADTLRVWRVMEGVYDQGKVLNLGISNCYDLNTLKQLHENAKIKPKFLQNRFHAETGYDRPLRDFCEENGIKYQSFWTLTANPHILKSSTVLQLATKYNKTPAQILFRFVQAQNILPLTGTSSQQHMTEDLDSIGISLTAGEIAAIDLLL